MDRYSAKKILSFLIVVSLAFFLVTALYGSNSAPSLMLSAEQIIGEISDLEATTSNSSLPHTKIHHLNNRLDRASHQLEKGIHFLQQNNAKRAKKHFRKARIFVHRYIRLLTQYGHGKHHTLDQDDFQWIASLKAQASEIRKHIRQLIRGDVGNSVPIANAGPDQSVQSGQVVTLDGSASSDPDGDMLQYSWVILSQPLASDIVLSGPQTTTPSFTPYASGSYIFELTVSDDESVSQPDTVIVTVSSSNTRPIANAGQDQTGTTGDIITLDGSASSDADGDSLSFDWSLLTIPDGSTSSLNDSTAVRPTFSPDLAGLYQARLIVNDGQSNSLEDVIDIQIDNLNTRPVAIAGPDQSVYINQLAQLDGSASHDADGDALSWLWSLVSTPSGSSAQLSDELAINPSFTADMVGQYVVQLVVDDSQDSSDPDSVIINAFTPNTIPVANAGVDQSDYVGNLVTLDGSASLDADGDNLTYNWSLTAIPDGSNAQLDDPNLVNSSFIIDIPGDYVAQLVVNDGKANSAPDEILISTLNSRPVANAGDDQTIMIGQTAQLDGAASADADNDTLSYSWSISSSPEGSTATLSDVTSATPTFTADQIGFYLFQLIVNDGILDSTPATLTLQVNPLEEIAVTLDEPSDQLFTNQTTIQFTGHLNHAAELTINDQPVTLGSDLSFDYPVTLQEGLNLITLVARDAVNSEAALIRNITLDTSVPGIPVFALISVSSPDAGVVTISGGVGSAEPFAQIVIVNLRTGETLTVSADEEGAFSAQINGSPGDAYSIAVQDAAGNQSEAIQASDGSGSLPPDPSTIAPPLNSTESTSHFDATSFLYTGTNPIQTGVTPGTIEEKRSAVIRGKVLDKQNNPLSGVTIKIKDHSEFGQTISRSDGMFDMVVNGGGQYVINYQMQDYLPAQRRIKTGWRDYYRADDVVLIELDPQVTTIDLTSTEPMQVAQGSAVSDIDGTRQATIMIPQGTAASMTLPDGSSQSLTSLDLRATEYTVGQNGPQSMPAPLPATSGYTYAVELSVDAAIAANAVSVEFSQPVQFYVDNFLNFPVGEVVPMGYLDRGKAAWIPSQNGKIIKIVSVTNGLAEISLDPSGALATQAELDALGITAQEQTELASTYVAGTELWRVQIEHLTPWDCNWPYGPPDDATSPKEWEVPKEPNDPCEQSGCIIEAETQVLGERIELIGTPYSLNYRSNRAPGSKTNNTLKIPISGDSLPASLEAIDLTIQIAGRTITQRYPATANQTITWEWDWKDAFGRVANTSQITTVTVDYIYTPVYYSADSDFTASFALAGASSGNGDLRIIGVRNTQEIKVSRTWQTTLGVSRIVEQNGLGFWSLSHHHAYDLVKSTLVMGDGTERNTDRLQGEGIITTVVGNGIGGFSGDGGLATEANIRNPIDVAIASDGTLYVADSANYRIRKVNTNGIITTVAGTGISGFSGDGGLAKEAQISDAYGIAVVGDTLYIADTYNHRIRKIDAEGIITTVVGDGIAGYRGDDGPANLARIRYPKSVAADSDGTLYFTDDANYRIRKVDPNGIITTVAGNGTEGCLNNDSTSFFSGDGILATEAVICRTNGIVLSHDGGFYYSDQQNHRIFKVGADGIITTVVGNGDPNTHFSGIAEGVLATNDGIREPRKIALSPVDNSLYLSYAINVIRHVGNDGIINTIAGNYPDQGYVGDDVLAKNAVLNTPYGLALDASGRLYIAESGNNRIRRIGPIWPGFSVNDFSIPSKDGKTLFRFDSTGRHRSTIDAFTGETLLSFGYTNSGLLETISDAHGDVTRIQRDSNGSSIQIIAPDGQVTTLGLDTDGYLTSVLDPAGQQHQMAYGINGLMSNYTSPNGHSSSYQYDEMGRLRQDTNSENGGWNLSRSEIENGYEVTMTSAEGRSTQYRVETLATNDRRRLTTSPDGMVTSRMTKTNGEDVITKPDGTISTAQMGYDPRFGLMSPIVANAKNETPGGLVSNVTMERTVTQADSADPLSLTMLRDTITNNGRVSTSEYSADNKTWTYASAAGRTSSVQINAKGQPVLGQITGLEQVSYSYDSRGRLHIKTEGAGVDARITMLDYYPSGTMAGFLQSITNAEGQITAFEYDAAGRVTKLILPDGREIGYGYDANSNLTSLTPPGRLAHVYQYDGVDQSTLYTPPAISGIDTPQTVYTYDRDNKLTQVTRPDGQLITRNYGITSGKLDSITMPRGSYSYSYNTASGNLDSITSPDGGVLTYNYDGFLTTAVNWTGTVAGSITQSYDNDFRVISRSINGADSIAYQYDDDGLLTQAGSLAINREAQKAGIINGTVLGGLTTARSYNNFVELVSFAASYNGNSLFNATYTRDKLGRITEKVEALFGVNKNTVYGYDRAGRLASETTDSVTTTYTYDANGNRTHIDGVQIGSYDAQDRLISYAAATYEYSDNGELQSKTESGLTTHYSYDVLGNLMQVRLPGDVTVDYVIDGNNRRIGKIVNGTLVQSFLYKDQLNPVAELDGANNVISRFIYGAKDNVPDYMIRDGISYRIISDHLGSPRLVVNTESGELVQRIDYDAWGNVIQDTNPGFQPFGFAGGLYDQHTQLIRFGFRDYDPETGSWTAKDPIEFNGSDTNLYAYVLNNPLSWIDVDGQAPKPVIGSGVEAHNGGREHVHWGPKANPRQNAVNKDGTIRHGKEPTNKMKKLINQMFGWDLKLLDMFCPLCTIQDNVPLPPWDDPEWPPGC